MSSYLYELPTTGAISFAEFCQDDTACYVSFIAEATESRANLRATLKESKRSDGEKDNLKLVKVLDEYLPKLCGILACVKSGDLTLKSEPIFSWRTTLSSSLFNASPRLSFPSLAAELAFTLLTYAFALSNLARAVVESLGSYEYERAISDAERKAKDERLAFAVALLCKSAGIFEHIAKEVMPAWDEARRRVALGGISCPNPPDLSREVLIGLSKLALADAQTLAIRKLLSRAAFDSTLTPGPPLPRSHPSPALAAKLHLECVAFYSSARALVKTPGASRPSPSLSKSRFKLSLGRGKESESGPQPDQVEGQDVVPELRRYLADETAYHNAMSHKWLGVDAGENGGTTQGGVAVGFLAWAKKELDDLKSGGLSHGAVAGIGITDREKDIREARRTVILAELGKVETFLKGYKRMNDTLNYQTVPPQSELQGSIPAGRAAIALKPYMRPTPDFGPGSVEHTRRIAEELDLAGKNDTTSATTGQTEGSYAGAGSYF
ncbi:hypothetical protein EUX98_g5447 [Antrodiella citrinella]|uniref:pH-response regulator protein palC n=1 Tax=Antrodiella citrinella TaxID=2447956 RepID=A0A4S4MUB9_9APHY|nr:hypothetical protein EUX98_g5447 [Antrodiella citrinella]